jgi:hypothetical protein
MQVAAENSRLLIVRWMRERIVYVRLIARGNSSVAEIRGSGRVVVEKEARRFSSYLEPKSISYVGN